MKINKMLLITSLSAFCGTALAGGIEVIEPNDIEGQPVFIASAPYRLIIGGTLFYGQPSTNSSYLDYATVEYVAFREFTSFTQYNNSSISGRDYDFGFDAFVRYNFVGTDRDLTISYLHFSDTDSDDTVVWPTNVNTLTIYNEFYHTAAASVRTRLDVADLLAGQNMHLGDALRFHFVGGLGLARVQQKFKQSYDAGLGLVTNGPSNARANEMYFTFDSQFQGIGPKLGVDADFDVVGNFGLVGGVSVALLMGSQTFTTHIAQASAPPPAFYMTNTDKDFDSNDVVVANFNANLGARYFYENFEAELGYRINHFADAVYDNSNFSLSNFYLKISAAVF
jgi:hypothetical protein